MRGAERRAALAWLAAVVTCAAMLQGAACGDIPLPPEEACAASEVPYNGKDDDCDPTTKDDDLDGDGFSKQGGGDCNDSDMKVFPGATEIPYDGIDQDCSGQDLADFDKDGYDSDKVSGGKDCDDKNANINPKGKEICGDTVDQDCDGYDLSCSKVDKDNDGYSPNQGDCDDNNKAINPGATEIPYNGKDDDCDLQTPDDDLDEDGYNKVGGGDCNDNSKAVNPGATEVPYDGVDQDCSGKDLTDKDKDGHDSTKVTGGDDCDDDDAKVHPGAQEIPYDSIDQDCNSSDLITAGTVEILSAVPNQSLQYPIDVASSAGNHLVVWRQQNYNGSTWSYSIRSQILSATGAKVGGPQMLQASSTSSASGPVVAGDGGGFYVAWRDAVAPNNRIMIRNVTATGAVSVVTKMIYQTAESIYTPLSLAYSSGTYALAFQAYASPNRFVRLLRFNTGGSYMGLSTLHTNSSSLNRPHVTGGSNFLVTWYQSNSSTSYDILSRVVSPAGALIGGLTQVSTNPAQQYYPRGDFDGTNFLVAFRDTRMPTSDIYGQAIAATGSLLFTTQTVNFPISSAPSTQTYPDVVYCNGRYTVVFVDSRYPTGSVLSKQAVGTDGKLKDTLANKNVVIYASGRSIYYPRATCAGSMVLVVWVENESTGYSIKAKLTAP
jgi:Putative metal-binding motif